MTYDGVSPFMIGPLRARMAQGYRTIKYPQETPVLPERYLGLPRIDASKCPAGCSDCVNLCPVDAITGQEVGIACDLGRCIFCGECARVCPAKTIEFTSEHRMACHFRDGLIVDGRESGHKVYARAAEVHRLFGRSFRLRQVSAGGCNACEADTNVLSTITYDIGRFGIQFVASPRHADGILVTGPVTKNMELALMKTYDAVPGPKVVIAVGACAISGGIFSGHSEAAGGVTEKLPVDLFIPGCPPHPLTILDGLLRLLGRVG